MKVSFPHTDQLSEVVRAGVRTLLWFGDADFVCGYKGGYEVAKLVDFAGRDKFNANPLTSFTVNGEPGGLIKTVDNFSYMQVFNSGHMVPYYQPELSLQVFRQMVYGQNPTST